jgi:hypothetical protein
MKTKTIIILLLAACSYSFAQMNSFTCKREIKGIKGQWNSIELHDDMYGKINASLADIRIFGITSNNDTVEAPYFQSREAVTYHQRGVGYKPINQTKNENGYYFTFGTPDKSSANLILLNFGQTNYDWRVKLEGSQNQNEWFTIVDNYRILSIKNGMTDYQFNKIPFQETMYAYYRICIRANEQPRLKSANIEWNGKPRSKLNPNEICKLKTRSIKKLRVTEDKRRKETIVDIDLGLSVPVDQLKIGVRDTLDYYRPIAVEYLTDSFKTEKSWYYNYSPLATTTTLNSIEKHEFSFGECVTNKLRITISNNDNRPLKLGSFVVSGHNSLLIARITEPATYYLCYGKKDSEKPNYDLIEISRNIQQLNNVTLGNEQFVDPDRPSATEPLFMNKTWLWALMAVIIVVLGWFTFRMMKK